MTIRAGHYRPTFDVQLTPKQRRVLTFIERGKTNFEIAQELGVSLEGAKYHVSEILARLDVSSREEAVQVWREHNSLRARYHRAIAGFAGLPLLRIALAGAALVPVAVITVVVIALASDGGPDSSIVDPAADETASPSPVPTDANNGATSPAVPTATTSPATSPQATPTPGATALRVYFMRDEYIAPVLREVPATQAVARAALEELLSGTTASETATGLTTSIPSNTRLLDITISGRVATVDLSREFESGGGSLSMRARLAQVVYTLTQFPTVDAVAFRIDGEPTTVFGGEGVTLGPAVGRDAFEDLTPAILLDSPAQGATVSSPLHLTGTANTFEATFRVAVLDANGAVLAEEFATATSGTGTRGTFDITLEFAVTTPGPATIRVFESSARDGSPINVVDTPVTLAP